MGSRLITVVTASVVLFVGVTGAQARPSWPRPATKASITRKIGIDQWHKAERVARCETGGRVDWYVDSNGDPTGKYVSMMGMYVGTYNYGRRVTGYNGDTKPEQIAIAIGAFRITGGWSGWGCGGA